MKFIFFPFFFFLYSAQPYLIPLKIQPSLTIASHSLPDELFIQHLFECIAQNFDHIKLTKTDLFHGHVITTENDIIIIFHAKEYPDDLYWWHSQKSGYTTQSPEYHERNFLWSCNANIIWLLKAEPGNPDYQTFLELIIPKSFVHSEDITMALRAYTVQQEQFGEPLYNIYLALQ